MIELLKQRRSVYELENAIPMDESEFLDSIDEIILNTPSAFNSQSQRVVVLLQEKHIQFWNIVKETLKKIVPAENFQKTEDKINTLQTSYGTILFYNDEQTIQDLQTKFPLYREQFTKWAFEQNGMLQSNIWVFLASNQIGGSLQHYENLIEKQVEEAFQIPSTWKMYAEMPFGKIKEHPAKKPKMDVQKRRIILK